MIPSDLQPVEDLNHCEQMGYDCETNGTNTDNCNFRIFGTKEGMEAWVLGKNRAKCDIKTYKP